MSETKTQTKCTAIISAMWPDASIEWDDTVAGEHSLRVKATVPPLRGTTIVAEITRGTEHRAWQALLAVIMRKSENAIGMHRMRAEDLTQRAHRESERAKAIEIARGGA